MASCPFCHSRVPEILVLHGGSCPHCFGQIPGEETATDPGEAVKAQIRVEDERKARWRQLLPVLIATPLCLLAVGGAWVVLQPPPEVEPLMLENFDIDLKLTAWEGPEVAQADGARSREVAPVKRTQPNGRNDAAEAKDAGSKDAIVEGDYRHEPPRRPGAVVEPGAPGAPIADRERPSPSTGSTGGFIDINASVERGNPLLTEREDVQRAVKDLLRARGAQLQQCYEQALKSNESLAGVWKAGFSISKEGAFSSVRVTATGMADSGFERCVSDKLSSWSIRGRLAEPMPVTLPLTFKPS